MTPDESQLTPEQEQSVEALTRGIINKIAHGPISELRREAGHTAGEEPGEVISFVRRMFHLGDRSS